ncbi:DUF4180 domain-containing protein [Jiangella asiatica]|uniref:DUF4180 domain-containing protein n=1 Tax=Jiangella asiatica TaxID=2530372 RepID=A0A4V2Z0G2_9ACTN|nr:DUF4180 domain-containing protein [Jiangella asiatica]TDE00468.1 DUF4180 domain-containing protein [Jiangella asiatica]
MTIEGVVQLHGVNVLTLPADGPPLRTEADALDLVGDSFYQGAELVAVPADRLSPEFFDLSTGVAGAVTQKVVNYRLRLAVVGDIAAHLERSGALRDYVRESNAGRQLWFVASMDELGERLAGHR